MFSFNRTRRRSSSSLFRGGLLSTLLVTLAPFLYRKFMQKKSAGRLGLREAYAGGSTEW
jgi:hypothetical protein